MVINDDLKIDYEGCPSQICAHPTCWYAAKKYLVETRMQRKMLEEKERNATETTTPVPVNSPCQMLSDAENLISRVQVAKEKGRESRVSRVLTPLPQGFANVPLNCKAAARSEKIYIWNGVKKKTNTLNKNKQTAERTKLPIAEVAPFGLPPRTKTPMRNPILKKKRNALQLPMKPVLIGDALVRNNAPLSSVCSNKSEQGDVAVLRKVPIDVLLRGMVMSLKCRALTVQQARLLMNQVTGLNYHVAEVKDEATQSSSFYVQPISKIAMSDSPEKPACFSDASFVTGAQLGKRSVDSLKTSSFSGDSHPGLWMVGSDGVPRKVSVFDSASMAFASAPDGSLVDLKSTSNILKSRGLSTSEQTSRKIDSGAVEIKGKLDMSDASTQDTEISILKDVDSGEVKATSKEASKLPSPIPSPLPPPPVTTPTSPSSTSETPKKLSLKSF